MAMAHTKAFLEKLTPKAALELLKDGNKRFINNLKFHRNLLQQLNETADGQYPFAVILSCMDSRTSTELIFDQGLGEVFSLRVAGNVSNDDILGSMEFACKIVGSKLIIVLGHTKCGAIKGACTGVEMGNLTGLLEKIKPVIEKTGLKGDDLEKEVCQEKVAHTNVLHTINEIIESSSIIRQLLVDGKIGIVGGMYSVDSGKVEFIKEIFQENAVNEIAEATAV
jgi:carbonic anhydrase